MPNTKTGINFVQSFNDDSRSQGYHTILESYLTLKLVAQTLKKWSKLILVSWKLRSIDRFFSPLGSGIWLWPMLKKDWLCSIKGATSINNCLWIELFDAALKDIPHQSNGLYLFENQGWERAFLHAWRKHGHGKIIGVPHATVPFWHLYYFDDPRAINARGNFSQPLPDQLAVNGPLARKAFLESGYSSEQLVEVEALRYLNLEVSPIWKGANAVKSKRKHKSDHHQINILVVGDILPLSNHQLLCELEKAKKILPEHYSLTFKPHPGLDVNLNNYPCLKIQKTSEALDSILYSYNMVISTTSTSATVDAFLAGIPVIIRIDGSTLNLSPLRGQDGVFFVTVVDDFVESITAILNSDTVNKKQEMFWTDPHLPRWKTLLNLD